MHSPRRSLVTKSKKGSLSSVLSNIRFKCYQQFNQQKAISGISQKFDNGISRGQWKRCTAVHRSLQEMMKWRPKLVESVVNYFKIWSLTSKFDVIDASHHWNVESILIASRHLQCIWGCHWHWLFGGIDIDYWHWIDDFWIIDIEVRPIDPIIKSQ